MASFSERAGYKAQRTVIQHEALDDETRIQLWNCVNIVNDIANENNAYQARDLSNEYIWTRHFGKPRDELPSYGQIWGFVKTTILEGTWIEALDIVDAYVVSLHTPAAYRFQLVDKAIELLNSVLERCLVDCRFIDGDLVQVGNKVDVEALSDALDHTNVFMGARQSIKRAAELLSDRSNPDYLNSIKESISAVESVVKKVTGAGTLGAGLKKLEGAGVKIHPALQQAWEKMYGWTSDADGIRHAAIEESDSDQATAKYMLVACSAFVSYVIESGKKTDLI